MPFTLSHAGFVLPLKRVVPPHVLCGLMIGSIVPDFGYFVRAFEIAGFAHTVPGAICVSLPIGLSVHLLLMLFAVRIASALPAPHSWFLLSGDIGWQSAKRHPFAIITAILAGALSHNFIDSFTHESGFMVTRWPMLGREVLSLGGEPVPLFRILQYSGSVLGMVMVLICYVHAIRRYCRTTGFKLWQDPRGWLAWSGLAGATMFLAVMPNAGFIPEGFDFRSLRVFGFKFLITWLPILGVVSFCYALLRPRSKS